MTGLVIGVAAVSALVVFVAMKKSGHFLKAFILTGIQGCCALLAVNALGVLMGVSLPINVLTVGTGVIFGTPGVIMSLLTQIILA